MNLFELFVKVGVDDQASGPLETLAGKLGSGLQSAAKVGLAAVSAAAAGVAALTTAAVKNYAEYEQLVGGAELMFGDAYETVAKNAKNAFKTVQMSQNDYLQQVNGFATGLKTALDGNEQAAADLAHKIIQAEADVVAATGNSQEAIQNAFNGIMKSNFTMLDNLQIGITPTKEGFQEVIDKVNEWNKANGQATEYQMGNLADMQAALVDYIDMVGMSGYAQREAAQTITGSLASAKSAWQNLLTGLADGSADVEKLIENLVETIVGDGTPRNLGVLGNVLPAVEKAIGGVIKLVEGAAPQIIAILPQLVNDIVPKLISAATELVNSVVIIIPDLLQTIVNAILSNTPKLITAAIGIVKALVDGIKQNYSLLISSAFEIIEQLSLSLLSFLPEIVSLGLDILLSLAEGINSSLDTLIPAAVQIIIEITETIYGSLGRFFDVAVKILGTLANNIVQNLPLLIESAIGIVLQLIETITDGQTLVKFFTAAVEIIKTIVGYLLEPENLKKIIDAAVGIIESLVSFVVENLPMLLNAAIEIIMSLVEYLLDPSNLKNLVTAAIDIVVALMNAIVDSVYLLVDAAVALILTLVEFLLAPERIKQMLEAGAQILIAIVEGIMSMISHVDEAGKEFIDSLWKKLTNVDWGSLGKGIIDGILGGLKSAWDTLSSWVSNAWNSLFGDKDEPSFSLPSQTLSTEELMAMKSGQKSVTGYVSPPKKNSGSTVNVTQNIYSSAKTPSELMTEAYYQQKKGLVD